MSDELAIVRVSTLEGIADAVREKRGLTEKIKVDQIEAEARNIQTGGGGEDVSLVVGVQDVENKPYSLKANDFGEAKQVPAHWLRGRSGLISFDLPESVTSIGTYAFYGCTGLKEAKFGNTVSVTNKSILEGCNSLEKLTIPFVGVDKADSYNINYIGYIFGASSYSSNATYVPASLKTIIVTGSYAIKDNAFKGCNNIKSVSILGNAPYIAKSAFEGCSGIEEITLPYIGGSKDAEVDNTYYKERFGYIFNKPFGDIPSTLKSVTILGGTVLRDNAFAGCKNIETIILPDTIVEIGNSAFASCKALTAISIPNKVAIIPNYAFQGCGKIKNITIPASVEAISKKAFDSCSSLESVEFIGGDANRVKLSGASQSECFANCPSLRTMTINGGSPIFEIDGLGDIIDSQQKIDVNYIGDLKGLCEVEFVSDYNMSWRGKLYINNEDIPSELVVPSGTTKIGEEIFSGCDSITSVVIENDVKTIGVGAFAGCPNLTNITIGDSVETISGGAFAGCDNIQNVEIGVGIKKIENGAFYNWAWGFRVRFNGTTPPELGSDVFYIEPMYISIEVPKGCKDAYLAGVGWDTLPSNVTIYEFE